jgi:hypothetical protein
MELEWVMDRGDPYYSQVLIYHNHLIKKIKQTVKTKVNTINKQILYVFPFLTPQQPGNINWGQQNPPIGLKLVIW